MKYLFQAFLLFFLLCPSLFFAQEVTTLANVTANGGVTLDAEGNLFVAHFGPLPFVDGEEGKNIYKITPTGDVSLFVDNQLTVGSGNHIDSEGFLYQSNFALNRVFKIDAAGEVVDNNFAAISGPVGITVIENDTLIVCECSTGSLIKIAQDGTKENFISSTLFACVNGITQDNEGIIYTTNFSDGRINRITKDGNISTIGSTPVGIGHIAFRPLDQHLYVASYSDNRIYKMNLDGEVSVFAGTGEFGALDSSDPLLATFSKPNGIEVSKDGCSLYVTQDEGVIREIKLNDHGCTTSVEDVALMKQIDLYPNPSSGEVFYTSKGITFDRIQILDIYGRLILELDPNNISFIDLSFLNNGCYLIQFIASDEKKFLKRIVLNG